MKILHCCLAAFYIDNYGYQENVLPKMHKLQGHDVYILASTETFINNTRLGYIKDSSYYTNENIPITRIPYVKWLPHFVARKLRIYTGILKILNEFKPDIIFLHDVQFISIKVVANYIRINPNVKLFVDGHTDFINSATNWVSKHILHKIIYKWCALSIESYVRKFYGVLPLRVDFFKNVYGIPESKLDLLVLGADDTLFDLSKKESIRERIRNYYGIENDDFLIVTGGKIDKKKNIHLVMKAIQELDQKIKLIVFGSINDDIKDEINLLSGSKNIRFIGWLPTSNIYDVLLASDLAIYPGTHSVLWEQTVGLGLPCIFKRWEGMQHVDVGGNCLFIDEITIINIKEIILRLYNDPLLLNQMKKTATERGIKRFSYFEIAKYAIEQ